VTANWANSNFNMPPNVQRQTEPDSMAGWDEGAHGADIPTRSPDPVSKGGSAY
jgi:hypothetical protein